MGDVPSHIFRIDTRDVDFSALFSSDLGRVVTDSQGRAAVTLDFVCLRCHTDPSAIVSNAVGLDVGSASALAGALHGIPQ
jgi:hypothetical protein